MWPHLEGVNNGPADDVFVPTPPTWQYNVGHFIGKCIIAVTWAALFLLYKVVCFICKCILAVTWAALFMCIMLHDFFYHVLYPLFVYCIFHLIFFIYYVVYPWMLVFGVVIRESVYGFYNFEGYRSSSSTAYLAM